MFKAIAAIFTLKRSIDKARKLRKVAQTVRMIKDLIDDQDRTASEVKEAVGDVAAAVEEIKGKVDD
jgi:uncharacterized Fe-S cluster-containing protein